MGIMAGQTVSQGKGLMGCRLLLLLRQALMTIKTEATLFHLV